MVNCRSAVTGRCRGGEPWLRGRPLRSGRHGVAPAGNDGGYNLWDNHDGGVVARSVPRRSGEGEQVCSFAGLPEGAVEMTKLGGCVIQGRATASFCVPLTSLGDRAGKFGADPRCDCEFVASHARQRTKSGFRIDVRKPRGDPHSQKMDAGVRCLVCDAQERDSKIRRLAGRAGAHGAGLEVLLVEFPLPVVVDGVDEQDLAPVVGGLDFALVE